MKQLKRWARATRVRAMFKDDSGAAMLEYGLLVGLIAVVSIGAITALGDQIHNVFCTVVTDLAATGIASLADAAGCPALVPPAG